MSDRSSGRYKHTAGRWVAKSTTKTNEPRVAVAAATSDEVKNVFLPLEFKQEGSQLYPLATKFRRSRCALRFTLQPLRVQSRKTHGSVVQWDANWQRLKNIYDWAGVPSTLGNYMDQIEADAIYILDHWSRARTTALPKFRSAVHPASIYLALFNGIYFCVGDAIKHGLENSGGLFNFKTSCMVVINYLVSNTLLSPGEVLTRVKLASDDEMTDPLAIGEREISRSEGCIVFCPFVGELNEYVPCKRFSSTAFELVLWSKTNVYPPDMDWEKALYGPLSDTWLTRNKHFADMQRVINRRTAYRFFHHPSTNTNHVVLAIGQDRLQYRVHETEATEMMDYGLICIFANILTAAHHAGKDMGKGSSYYGEIFGPFDQWSKALSSTSGRLRDFTIVVMTAGRLMFLGTVKSKYVPHGVQDSIGRNQRWKTMFDDSVDYINRHGQIGAKVLASVANGCVPDELCDLASIAMSMNIGVYSDHRMTRQVSRVITPSTLTWPDVVKSCISAAKEGAVVHVPKHASWYLHPLWRHWAFAELSKWMCVEPADGRCPLTDFDELLRIEVTSRTKFETMQVGISHYASLLQRYHAIGEELAILDNDYAPEVCPGTGRIITGLPPTDAKDDSTNVPIDELLDTMTTANNELNGVTLKVGAVRDKHCGIEDGNRTGEAAVPGPTPIIMILVDLDNVNEGLGKFVIEMRVDHPDVELMGFCRYGDGAKYTQHGILTFESFSMIPESADALLLHTLFTQPRPFTFIVSRDNVFPAACEVVTSVYGCRAKCCPNFMILKAEVWAAKSEWMAERRDKSGSWADAEEPPPVDPPRLSEQHDLETPVYKSSLLEEHPVEDAVEHKELVPVERGLRARWVSPPKMDSYMPPEQSLSETAYVKGARSGAARNRMNEWTLKNKKTLSYKVKTLGNSNAPRFTAHATIDETCVGIGSATTVAQAKENACIEAMQVLRI